MQVSRILRESKTQRSIKIPASPNNRAPNFNT
jgi:hypothetical protein